MIKAKVISITYSESVGGIPKLDLETYLEDPVVPELFCGADFWDGRDVVVITKEEYESLSKKLNEKEGEICKLIVNNDVEQARLREKIKKLKEENKGMEEVSDILHKSLLDEREKTRKLKEENEAIQKDIKDLEEKMAEEAAEVDIHPDGTIVFKKKRVSELEKEVKKLQKEIEGLEEDKRDLNYRYALLNCENITLEKEVKKLKEENKALKEDKITMKITGGLFYKED